MRYKRIVKNRKPQRTEKQYKTLAAQSIIKKCGFNMQSGHCPLGIECEGIGKGKCPFIEEQP